VAAYAAKLAAYKAEHGQLFHNRTPAQERALKKKADKKLLLEKDKRAAYARLSPDERALLRK
jgi:hypothetical protein